MPDTIFKSKPLCLADIARKADWVRMDAIDLRAYVLDLAALPDFDTEAEEKVKLALSELYNAALRIEEARAHMVAKREHQAHLRKNGRVK